MINNSLKKSYEKYSSEFNPDNVSFDISRISFDDVVVFDDATIKSVLLCVELLEESKHGN